MVISQMHFREIESIEDIKEKIQVVNLLDIHGKEPKYNFGNVRKRADEFSKKNFGIADAIHLAFAEQSANYLITCDDKFIKRSKRSKINIEVLNPIEFCIKEELKWEQMSILAKKNSLTKQ